MRPFQKAADIRDRSYGGVIRASVGDGRRPVHETDIFRPYFLRGDQMPKAKKAINDRSDGKPSLRLEPEKRMCPIFDNVSIAKFPVAAPGEMGYRVLDNFCEEHIE